MSNAVSCTICYEFYTNTDEICTTNCGHVFHVQCLRAWFERSPNCPKCRLDNPQDSRLYLNFDENGEFERRLQEWRIQLETQEVDFQYRTDELKTQLEQSLMNSSELQNQLDESEKQSQSLKRELEDRIIHISNLEENDSIYKVQLEEKILQIGELETQKELKYLETQDMRFALEKSTLKAARLEQTVERIEKNLNELQAQLEESILKSSRLEHERDEIEIKWVEMIEKFQENASKTNELEMQLKISNDQLETLKSDLEIANIQLKLQKDLNNTKEQQQLPTEMKSEMYRNFLKIRNLEHQLEKYKTTEVNLNGRLNEKNAEIEKLAKEISELKTKSALKESDNTIKAKAADPHKNYENDPFIECQLLEENKLLTRQIKCLSEELHKAIQNTTELTVDKIKLQSQLDYYTKSDANKPNLNSNDTTTTTTTTTKALTSSIAMEEKVINHINDDNKNINNNNNNNNNNDEDDNDQYDTNSLVSASTDGGFDRNTSINIRDIPLDSQVTAKNEESQLKYVLKLANIINVPCTPNDIEKVSALENKFKTRYQIETQKLCIVVKFKTYETMQKFLTHKNQLKNNPETKNIKIYEYANANTFSLYHHAKLLRNIGYKFFFCSNSKVFAKQHRNSLPLQIHNKKQVDDMLLNANEEKVEKQKPPTDVNNEDSKNPSPKVDDQLYLVNII